LAGAAVWHGIMASIFSALNVGSGIDVRSLVTGLVAAERHRAKRC